MFKYRYVFLLVLLALFDTFFAYAFGVDFSFRSMSFVSHLCFSGLLIWTAKLDWLDRILAGALCGILFDFFFVSAFPTSFILFPFLSWLCGMIYQRFEQEPIRLYALTLGGVLLLDAIPFFFYKFIQRLQVSTGIWFVHVELFTILFHIVAYAGYHYLSNYMAANERVDLQQGRGQLRRRVRRLRPMGK